MSHNQSKLESMYPFYILFTGRFISVFFNRLVILALSIILYEKTKNPVYVSLVFFWSVFPSLVFLGFFKSLVQYVGVTFRLNWLLELITASLTMALFIMIVPALGSPWLILLYVALASTANNLSKVTHQLLTDDLISENRNLIRANTANETMHNLSWVLAPMLAAFFLLYGGINGLLAGYILGNCIYLLTLYLIKNSRRSSKAPISSSENKSSPNIVQQYRLLLYLDYQSKLILWLLFTRNILSAFLAASIIPLVLSSYSLSMLGLLCLLGNAGIVAAFFFPLSYDSVKGILSSITWGQIGVALSLILMGTSLFYLLALGLFIFLYTLISTNSLDVMYFQRNDFKINRDFLFGLREQMGILGRLTGYALSGLLLSFLMIMAPYFNMDKSMITSWMVLGVGVGFSLVFLGTKYMSSFAPRN
ncbi:MAG: hypothetical protein Q8M40_04360 [Legionella sp.]|nr:hypothetical protein [Legionella sp.]